MALPAFTDLINLSSSNSGLTPESMDERILTCLAIMASGKNPDGTPSTGQQQQLVLGDGTTTGQVSLTLNSAGPAGSPMYIIFKQGTAGTGNWYIYEPGGDNNLYIRDNINAIQCISFTPGPAATSRIFLGSTLLPVQATTAAAPNYIVGGMYYDTTLHKLRIGGATGWETVTSA